MAMTGVANAKIYNKFTEGLDIEDYIWYRREVLHRDAEALTEIADVVQFLANAGCYGKNLRVVARRAP